jgi:hypothetical protein
MFVLTVRQNTLIARIELLITACVGDAVPLDTAGTVD